MRGRSAHLLLPSLQVNFSYIVFTTRFSFIGKNFLIWHNYFMLTHFLVLRVYCLLSNLCFLCSLSIVFTASSLIFRHVEFSLAVSNISIKSVMLLFGSQVFSPNYVHSLYSSFCTFCYIFPLLKLIHIVIKFSSSFHCVFFFPHKEF